MSRRHVETITDFLVVAVSPALVILMVSSLVFFVEHCFYDGNFDGRLRFASGLFVMAAVLIARISIEEGREYASMFAVPLSVVTILSMLRYTDIGLLLVLPLVAFIWWSTDKLTWDCTVIDDQKDTSGEGLLQTIGLDDKGEDAELDVEATTDQGRADQPTFWQRWLAHRKRQHTPGVWVIYFGLAAIPMFGLGQLFIPEPSRGPSFLLLCIYVASALALLMATSFLQMRRYLIQRRLPFTDQMAAVWLASGGMIIVGLMIFCLMLPRPNTGYSLIDSVTKVSSKDRRASRFAVGKEGVRDDEQPGRGESDDEQAVSDGEDGQQTSKNAEQGNQPGENGDGEGNGDSKGNGKTESSQKSESAKSDDRGKPTDGNQDRGDEEDAEANQRESDTNEDAGKSNTAARSRDNDDSEDANRESKPQTTPPPNPSSIPSNPLPSFSLPPIPKIIYFLVIAALALFGLIRYGREIGAAISAFIADLREMIRRLLGGKPRTNFDQGVAEETLAPEPERPFAAYQDPFAMGTADRFTPQQLVNYTFEALQAWARERHCGRSDEQTPLEFASQVNQRHRKVGPLARNLAILYNQAAYAPGTLGPESLDHVRSLWRGLKPGS